MIGYAAAFAVFVLGAMVVLRLSRRDAASGNAGRATSGVAVWLVYFFHAQTVLGAAYADVGRLELPKAPFMLAGLSLAVVGWCLFVGATLTLVRHGRFAGLRPTALVTSGPYRVSRHPQNGGWALLLLGVAIASQSVIALLLVAAFAVFSARLARLEDAELEHRHGDAYRSYHARTGPLPVPSLRRAALPR